MREKFFLCVFFWVGFTVAAAQESADLAKYCWDTHLQTAQCPQDVCKVGCIDQPDGSCFLGCLPKKCFEIPAAVCPADQCQILKGCSGEEVCYARLAPTEEACGGLGYHGQDMECCEGLSRRCGVEFFDGTCQRTPQFSIYSVGICIPCGNKICEQFENRCNCAEDCG